MSVSSERVYTLGFIGGGNMSSAVGGAVLRTGLYRPENVWVSGPRLCNLNKWAVMGVHTTTKNSEVVHNCDIIFLGVKPNILGAAVAGCMDGLDDVDKDKEVLFVSMLAGVTIACLQKELVKVTSNARVIRTMPNTPMLVGAGACLYAPGHNVTPEQCKLVEKILGNCGVFEKVEEKMIDSFGALTGCGPAFVYMIIEGLADGAVKQGVPRASAIRFAAHTVLGSARMVLDSGRHPAQLRDEVCSPGGSTICGVSVLETGCVRGSLINAVEASAKRNKELGVYKKET